MNLNKITIAGRLTRDPELRATPNGTSVCEFGLAINRKYAANGQPHEETTFLDVMAWGKTGENIAKYLAKGSPIYIEGRLKLDSWDDKTTGKKRSKLSVVADTFQFIDSPSQRPAQSHAPAPQQQSTPADDEGGDDIPF